MNKVRFYSKLREYWIEFEEEYDGKNWTLIVSRGDDGLRAIFKAETMAAVEELAYRHCVKYGFPKRES